jgi:hypothetical protein
MPINKTKFLVDAIVSINQQISTFGQQIFYYQFLSYTLEERHTCVPAHFFIN